MYFSGNLSSLPLANWENELKILQRGEKYGTKVFQLTFILGNKNRYSELSINTLYLDSCTHTIGTAVVR